jgi:hypothetical protein
MARRVAYLAVIPVLAAVLGGCALTVLGSFEPRAAWRDAEERACMADRASLADVSFTPMPRIDGRGACGISAPLKVAALEADGVTMAPNPTIGCPLAAALDAWLAKSVQPAAIAWFGLPVVEIDQLDAYSCRSVDNIAGQKLSEHAFGNAIDIAGFRLADGRTVTVKRDFRSRDPRARGFLHEIFAAACARFKTALGPGEPLHDDHFHLDLAHHNAAGTSQYCNPAPDVVPPPRPAYDGAPVAAVAFPGALRAGADRKTIAAAPVWATR